MCLAIPALITAIDPARDLATVALGGVSKEVSLALLEDAAIGDYVLVHVGYALNKISSEEAEITLRLMAEMGIEVGSGIDSQVGSGIEPDTGRGTGASTGEAA